MPVTFTQGPNVEEETRHERYREQLNEMDVSQKNKLIGGGFSDEGNLEELSHQEIKENIITNKISISRKITSNNE